MGCDIHAYKEKLIDGKWVTADKGWADEYSEGWNDVPHKNRYTGRNYDMFGLLSKGVRRSFDYSFEPRGMPDDACPEVAAINENWGCDGHGHSYLSLAELKEKQAFLQTTTLPISGLKDPEGLAELEASIATGAPEWSLIYPYWQGGDGVRFSFNVPATFAVDLTPIIELFDEADGPEQRLVFWFDN
jgi:hypothetical protein